jgi:DNA-binding transcriptional LysR family regulator
LRIVVPPDLDSQARTASGSSAAIQIDLVELETFLVVLELGSFSQAAHKLHISQPSVTGRVQRLESTLKTKLLIRNTRKVEATEAGRRLYEKAQSALHELRILLGEFRTEAENARRRVVVASTPMIAAVMLPPLIGAFCNRYPDVDIQLRDVQYEEVVKLIESGAADLGVVAFDDDSSKLIFHPLLEEEMLLVVHSSHPLANAKQVSLDEIANLPLMFLERYSSLKAELMREMEKRGLAFRPVHEIANLNTLLGMVDAGIGVTFLPRSMAQRYPRDTQATLSIKEVRLRRTYGILLSRKSEPTPAVESFCRYLKEEFR